MGRSESCSAVSRLYHRWQAVADRLCLVKHRRPDYRKLAVLKQQFPTVPLIALTATATEEVCQDLKEILQIEGCERFKSSVNRPNLFYQVCFWAPPVTPLYGCAG